jgi:hypothetical protein
LDDTVDLTLNDDFDVGPTGATECLDAGGLGVEVDLAVGDTVDLTVDDDLDVGGTGLCIKGGTKGLCTTGGTTGGGIAFGLPGGGVCFGLTGATGGTGGLDGTGLAVELDLALDDEVDLAMGDLETSDGPGRAHGVSESSREHLLIVPPSVASATAAE